MDTLERQIANAAIEAGLQRNQDALCAAIEKSLKVNIWNVLAELREKGVLDIMTQPATNILETPLPPSLPTDIAISFKKGAKWEE